jgi:hypothetical protein
MRDRRHQRVPLVHFHPRVQLFGSVCDPCGTLIPVIHNLHTRGVCSASRIPTLDHCRAGFRTFKARLASSSRAAFSTWAASGGGVLDTCAGSQAVHVEAGSTTARDVTAPDRMRPLARLAGALPPNMLSALHACAWNVHGVWHELVTAMPVWRPPFDNYPWCCSPQPCRHPRAWC